MLLAFTFHRVLKFPVLCLYSSPLIFFFSDEEHLNVTILPAPSVRPFPAAGIRPLCSRLSIMLNFPKPEMRMFSPDSSVLFTISKTISTSLTDSVFEHLQLD